MRVLVVLDDVVDKFLRWSVIGCVAGCLVFLAVGVVGRFLAFNISSYPEFIEILFAWSTFLGAALLWRERALLRVDFVQHMLPAGPSRVLKIVIESGMLIFAALMLYYGWDFATAIKEYTPFLQADRVYWYLSIPVSAAIMAGYSVAALYQLLTGPLLGPSTESRQQEIL